MSNTALVQERNERTIEMLAVLGPIESLGRVLRPQIRGFLGPRTLILVQAVSKKTTYVLIECVEIYSVDSFTILRTPTASRSRISRAGRAWRKILR